MTSFCMFRHVFDRIFELGCRLGHCRAFQEMERSIDLRGQHEVFGVSRSLACGACRRVCSGCCSSFGPSYDGSRGIEGSVRGSGRRCPDSRTCRPRFCPCPGPSLRPTCPTCATLAAC